MNDEMKTAISNLRRPEDIMKFFDDFFDYGCIDVDGVRHVDSLGGSDFRTKYRTLGLEDTLKHRIGACIEQTNATKYLLDLMRIDNRVFCTRGYNEEHRVPDDLYLVHCFTLAYFDGKVMNIEHSDSEMRGIYVYGTAEEAIRETHQLFSDKFIRHDASETTLHEYKGLIPGGLSFWEFNQHMNAIVAASEISRHEVPARSVAGMSGNPDYNSVEGLAGE